MKGKIDKKSKAVNNKKWLFFGVAVLLITIISCVLINVTFKTKNIVSSDKQATTTQKGKYYVVMEKASDELYKLFDFTGVTLNITLNGKASTTTGRKGFIFKGSSTKDGTQNYVYCIEFGRLAQSNLTTKYEKSSTNKSTYYDKMSKETKTAIEYLNLLGYPNKKRNSLVKTSLTGSAKTKYIADSQYLVTQVLIWEFQQGWRTTYNKNDKPKNSGLTLYNKTIAKNSSLKAIYDSILDDMNNFVTMPSFSASSSSSAKTLKYSSYGTTGKNYTLTLKDTSGVLKDTTVTCPSNLTCKTDGNNLTITSTKALTSNAQIKFTKTIKGSSDGLSFVDKGDTTYQRMAYGLTTTKTLTKYLNVITEQLGSITVQKETEDAVAGTFKFSVTGKFDGTKEETRTITINTKVSGNISTGTGSIQNISLGTYVIKETDCPARYVTVKQNTANLTSSKPDYIVKLQNVLKSSNLKVKKVDSETGEMIPGATLILYKGTEQKDANKIDKWVTTTSVHTITSALEVGTYTLCEISAPAGYINNSKCDTVTVAGTSNDVEIKVNGTKVDGNLAVVYNTKSKITIKKVDKNGNYVEGARLQVVDSNNKVIDEWTTNKQNHEIKGLVIGNSYTLKEISAPKGYLISKVVTFKAENNNTITMTDELISVKISKIDSVTRKGLKDAILALYDTDGNEIEKWQTTEAEYELKNISQLKANNKYILKELKAPDGYIKSADKEITIKADGVTTFTIENTPTIVSFSKQDATTSKEIPGAHLQIIDYNGDIVEEWDSEEGKSHVITGKLNYGDKYVLKETIAPKGYAVTEEIVFEVGSNTKVVMKNKLTEVKINKIDANSKKMLEGAKLELVDKESNVALYTWTSNGTDSYVITGLATDKEYIIREIEAPKDYKKSKDITFKLATTEQTRTIDVENAPIVYVPDTASDNTIINVIIGAILVIGGSGAIIFIRKGMEQN